MVTDPIAVYDTCRRLFLETTLLKPRCKYAGVVFDKVSAWSVGQHLEHVLSVNARGVVLLTSDPRELNLGSVPPITPAGLRILETGLIPRGGGKAPDAVCPKLTNHVDLEEDVERGISLVDNLGFVYRDIAADTALFPHPMLGGLTKAQWVRFLEIHVQHHHKIIHDIIARNHPGAHALAADGTLTMVTPIRQGSTNPPEVLPLPDEPPAQ